VTVAVNGTVLHGSLIAEERYFAGLAEVNSRMNALNPLGWAARQRLREEREVRLASQLPAILTRRHSLEMGADDCQAFIVRV
jgi:hypothetical protein